MAYKGEQNVRWHCYTKAVLRNHTLLSRVLRLRHKRQRMLLLQSVLTLLVQSVLQLLLFKRHLHCLVPKRGTVTSFCLSMHARKYSFIDKNIYTVNYID